MGNTPQPEDADK